MAWAVELPFKKEILIMAKGILRLSVLEKVVRTVAGSTASRFL